jgi:dynactin-6
MTTRPPATKRSTTTTTSTSSLPAARPPCNIDPTAVVADKAQITGSHPVTIGPHAVLHPYARIRAESGSVTIGAFCIIAEGAIVGYPEGQAGDVVLDRHVSVESGAEVLAERVGEGTEVGVNAKVGAAAMVGRFCRLTPTEKVQDGEVLEDFTVVFGNGRRRRDGTVEGSEEVRRQRVKVHERHVEVLKKLVPDGKGKWLG